MNSLNSILVEGVVSSDPELIATPSGNNPCCFTIASNRFYKVEDDFEQEVSLFQIKTWGILAEICFKNCTKDRGVRIVGRLKQEKWIDSEGREQSKIIVVAENVEFKPDFKAIAK